MIVLYGPLKHMRNNYRQRHISYGFMNVKRTPAQYKAYFSLKLSNASMNVIGASLRTINCEAKLSHLQPSRISSLPVSLLQTINLERSSIDTDGHRCIPSHFHVYLVRHSLWSAKTVQLLSTSTGKRAL